MKSLLNTFGDNITLTRHSLDYPYNRRVDYIVRDGKKVLKTFKSTPTNGYDKLIEAHKFARQAA